MKEGQACMCDYIDYTIICEYTPLHKLYVALFSFHFVGRLSSSLSYTSSPQSLYLARYLITTVMWTVLSHDS